jgi:hypothetical protein
MDPRIGIPHSLHSWAVSQALIFHTLSHSTVLPFLSLNLRDTVSPWLLAVTVHLWEVISLPFCLLSQAWIQTQVLTVWWAVFPSPRWFLCLTRFCCASEALYLIHRDESPSISSCPLMPGGNSAWQSRGMHPSDKGGDNSLCLHNLRWAPKKCCRKLLDAIQDTEAI